MFALFELTLKEAFQGAKTLIWNPAGARIPNKKQTMRSYPRLFPWGGRPRHWDGDFLFAEAGAGVADFKSPCLAGFQFGEHAPEAVAFAAFDYLQGSGAIEGGVGLLEPGADGFFVDEFG